MTDITLSAAASLLAKVRTVRPLLHHVTNHVTSWSSASMALACGASPVMAEASEESTEVAKVADALVLNLGTITTAKYEAMHKALKMAKARSIPVILDPVGVGLTSLRADMADVLLMAGVSVVRGNSSELAVLAGIRPTHTSIDGDINLSGKDAAQKTANKYACLAVATGETDYISGGGETYKVKNGHSLFASITGAGCMTDTLIAAFCAVHPEDLLLPTVAALLTMGVSGELAAEKADGPGSFTMALLDSVYKLTADDIMQRGKLEAV